MKNFFFFALAIFFVSGARAQDAASTPASSPEMSELREQVKAIQRELGEGEVLGCQEGRARDRGRRHEVEHRLPGEAHQQHAEQEDAEDRRRQLVAGAEGREEISGRSGISPRRAIACFRFAETRRRSAHGLAGCSCQPP